jgi:DNA-binding response OmpR family regulator
MSTPCRVLVVDDDADTREALADALSYAGYLVEQAAGGREALELISRSGIPDVILLDVHMPDIGGEQVLEQLRGQKARIVLMTADTSARVLQFARDAKLVHKPVGLDELEAAVKEACAA